MLLLWHRPAAVALIGPLAGESPYAVGTAPKSKTKKKKEGRKRGKERNKWMNKLTVLESVKTARCWRQ